MTTSTFTPPFENLPTSLPLFPLANAVVMPGCQLPLNIFEPRYVNMVLDALSSGRMIGMVQPEPAPGGDRHTPLYRTGTAGRITFFTETPDGRLLIVLTGVCRFDIVEEIPTTRGYRRATVDWSRFRCDYEEASSDSTAVDRQQLLHLLKTYFANKRLDTDWSAMDRLDTIELVNRLTCALPFEVVERQFLVESVSTEHRISSLMALLRCETLEGQGASTHRH
jgi:Lon protease-like protein